jgi:hypothetical protein
MGRRKWHFSLAVMFVLLGGVLPRQAAAGSVGSEASFTVQIYNYAGVDPRTLREAENVGAGIFRNAGEKTDWLDSAEAGHFALHRSADLPLTSLLRFQVRILSPEMAAHLDLNGSEMGLASGKGLDRLIVYICYSRIPELAKRQLTAKTHGTITRNATSGQILGAMIAHELGHLMLNLASHSETGIMRGNWDLKDLGDIADGVLCFTPQQSERIQTDIARRAASNADQKETRRPLVGDFASA